MHTVWLAKDGVQQGPLTLQQARRLIAEGRYGGHDFAWVMGSLSWTAIAEVPDLGFGASPPDAPFAEKGPRAHASPPPPPTPNAPTSAPHAVVGAPHPWRRYFARTLDYLLVGLVIETTFEPMLHLPRMWSSVAAALPTVLALVAYEAFCLGRFQTTLGKHLFGIAVTHAAGGAVTQTQSNARALRVGLFGMALGIPVVSSLTQFMAYLSIRNGAEALWDRQVGCTVIYRSVAFWQQLAASLLISGLEITSTLHKFTGYMLF